MSKELTCQSAVHRVGLAAEMTAVRPKFTLFAPFVHPKRDAYLSRARRLAGIVWTLAQALWFLGFLVAVRDGAQLTATFSLLGLFGLFFIASRAVQMGEISLGIMDRLAGMSGAPTRYEIFRRAGLGLIVPFLFFVLAFLRRDDPVILGGCLLGVVLCEVLFRLGGYTVWRGTELTNDMLKNLLRGQPGAALEAFRDAMPMSARGLEEGALAISGIAIRQNNVAVLAQLEDFLENRHDDTAEATRSLAVVRADHARLVDADSAGPAEAAALRLIPAGHPRRLALGLFVATAALDQDDPESAVKALRLLHSRDVLPSHGRVLVNWLLLEAAKRIGDTELAASCLYALRTFNVRRIADSMSISQQQNALTDPTARWIRRAREALRQGEPFS